MALKIRLSRGGGTKKRPVYSIVVADSRARATARFIRSSAATTRCCRATTPSG